MKRLLLRITAAASAVLLCASLFAVSVFASAEPTFAEKMGQAGRNTVIGIVIVFFILLVLSLIISLFRFIAPKKKQSLKKTEYVNVAREAEPDDEDEELAAVIMAAIVAAEGETIPEYAYRLKSIKRVKTTRRWNRAR